MNEEKFYVYTLSDPRNNHIFYVGKGTGARSKSHLKETLSTTKNSKKWFKIQNILDAGLNVKIDIVVPNLTESKAFEIEKILIHKIKRFWVTEQGGLLNLVPGGVWNPKFDSLHYDEEYNSDLEIKKLSPNIKATILSIIESQLVKRVEYPIDHNVKALQHVKPRSKGLTLDELTEIKNKLLGN